MKAGEIFKAVFDTSHDGIIISDHFGKIILANERIEKLFGYKPEELLGKEIEIFIPERFHHTHIGIRNNYINEPKKKEMDTRNILSARRKDGSEFYVEISLSPIKLEDETLIAAAIRDVSDKIISSNKIEAQTQLLKIQNEELERFAYLASHDLQEPLRTVSNYAGLFKRKYAGKIDNDADDYLEFISQATQRMQHLIKGLLEYSRIGFDKKPTKIDCNAMLVLITKDMANSIEESRAEIKIEKLPVINGNLVELKSLFQNLISNSIKYRKKEVKPIITISCSENDREYIFSVKDNGIGIDAKFHKKVFQLFMKLHSTSEYEGTGIGLSNCKKIVEMHGGTIWVESGLDNGSTFYFTIPKTYHI